MKLFENMGMSSGVGAIGSKLMPGAKLPVPKKIKYEQEETSTDNIPPEEVDNAETDDSDKESTADRMTVIKKDGSTSEQDLESDNDEASDKSDKMGIIRKVKGAHLVFKRKNEDGKFNELWVYNLNNYKDELNLKRDILSGTDIPQGKKKNKDGSQEYDIWTAGNVQMIFISGLPN